MFVTMCATYIKFIQAIYWYTHLLVACKQKNSVFVPHFLQCWVQKLNGSQNPNWKDDVFVLVCSYKQMHPVFSHFINHLNNSILECKPSNLVESKVVNSEVSKLVGIWIELNSFQKLNWIFYFAVQHSSFQPPQSSQGGNFYNVFCIVKKLCLQIQVLELNQPWKRENIYIAIISKYSFEYMPVLVPLTRNKNYPCLLDLVRTDDRVNLLKKGLITGNKHECSLCSNYKLIHEGFKQFCDMYSWICWIVHLRSKNGEICFDYPVANAVVHELEKNLCTYIPQQLASLFRNIICIIVQVWNPSTKFVPLFRMPNILSVYIAGSVEFHDESGGNINHLWFLVCLSVCLVAIEITVVNTEQQCKLYTEIRFQPWLDLLLHVLLWIHNA